MAITRIETLENPPPKKNGWDVSPGLQHPKSDAFPMNYHESKINKIAATDLRILSHATSNEIGINGGNQAVVLKRLQCEETGLFSQGLKK